MDATKNWALVPFLDCLNHSPDARTKTKISKTHFELITEVGASKDDQVFISYGAHSDTFLMLEYGFVTGNSNKLNFVDFEAKNLLKNGKSSQKRQKLDENEVLCRAKKLGCSEGLGVDSTGPTWSLIRFVAILCLGDVEEFIYENLSK